MWSLKETVGGSSEHVGEAEHSVSGVRYEWYFSLGFVRLSVP